MNTLKALLILLTFIWQEKTAAAQGTSPAPYTVDCTSTDNATLRLTDNTYLPRFPSGCTSTGPTFILVGACLEKTIYIYKEPASKTSNIIGGEGTIALNITCAVPPDGVTATPRIDVLMTASVSPTVESHPYTSVTMTLSKTDPTVTIDTALQAFLGEHLYLVIQNGAKTGGHNFLIPESCSASAGADTVDLWTLKSSGGSKCGSLQPTLLGNFTDDNGTVPAGTNEDFTYADLYAFKFKKSNSITFSCTVLVCPRSTKGHCTTEVTSMRSQKCLTKTRKRRSFETKQTMPHVRETVSATLTVSDFQGLSEGSQARVEGHLLLVAMFTTLLLSK